MRDRFLEPEENYAAPITHCDDDGVHTEDCLHLVLTPPVGTDAALIASIRRAIEERLKAYLPRVDVGRPSHYGWELDTMESCDTVNWRAQEALEVALYEAGIDEP